MIPTQESNITGAAHLALLGRLGFLRELPADDLAALAATMRVRDLPAGAEVTVQGRYATSMFVVVHGSARAFTTRPDGTRLDLGALQPGDYFGEDVLLGRGESSATVRTLAAVKLLEIEKYRIDFVFRRHPAARAALEDTYQRHAIATYLHAHAYLSGLPDEAQRELARAAKLELVLRGERVSKQGDVADRIRVVRDGLLKATRSHDGTLSILAYFNTGDVIGIHDGKKRDYDLDALGHCELISIERPAFLDVMRKNPKVAAHFGKDDMRDAPAPAAMGQTMLRAVKAFLDAGVEVESLLVINLDRCVRCGNCVRACHARHTFARLDRRGPIFRRRTQLAATRHEHVMLPSSCRHCRDPECMVGCPTGAIQRFAHGEVDINDNCVGCENCARKCPYGNIVMRELAPAERPNPAVVKRAIKCNLCRGYAYSNCVHECPRGAILRVDPLRFFAELAKVMGRDQHDAIAWTRAEVEKTGALGSKQRVRPRSTWFVPASLALGLLAIAGIVALVARAGGEIRGGSAVGLPLGVIAAGCLGAAASQAVRKRLRNVAIGGLEAWTQFHMMFGSLALVAAIAHAGFHVTGVFTALLLLVLALEVATGIAGELIYAFVPTILTRLERHGLARLIEDLDDEERRLGRDLDTLWASVPGDRRAVLRRGVDTGAGSRWSRMRAGYDAKAITLRMTAGLGPTATAEMVRAVEATVQLADVRAQIGLHHALAHWLIVHVAISCALVVLLAVHVATALTLVP